MEPIELLLLVAALLIGIGVGTLLARSQRGAEVAELRAMASEARSDLVRAQSEFSTLRADLGRADAERTAAVAEARSSTERARAESARVSAELAAAQAERDAALRNVRELAENREQITRQFQLLSAEALTEQGKQADAAAERRLVATRELMTPVERGLAQLNERITQVEKERAEAAASLRAQVQTVLATSENLRRETGALASALRKPQVRGAWGELQLKRVVEIAGMLEYCDFLQQVTDQTSADNRIRPDMKVLLGGDKFVYVDAKTPLAAYLDAMEATTDDEREARLHQFAEHVKTHIDKLSAKEYWKAATGTPEFVVLFIPAEALAAEALAQRPDLHEYAAARGIVLASPTTLIAMLRAVAYGWKQAALADSAAEVFELGRELHDRLARMGGHFGRLGNSLTSAVKAYNATLGSLEGRVLVSARRLRDLKVTDRELARLTGVDESTRLLSAPELLADAVATAERLVPVNDPEALEPGGPQPETFDAELVEQD